MIINYFAKFGAKVLYFSDTCNKKPQKVNFSAIFLYYITSHFVCLGLTIWGTNSPMLLDSSRVLH